MVRTGRFWMRFHFTLKEILDLLVSSIILTIAFWIFFNKDGFVSITEIVLGVTLGFMLHELAHKFIAQKMRYSAHYQMWKTGSILAIISSFLGFIFAAPGAVQIGPRIDLYGRSSMRRKDVGLIGLAGPMMNVLLALTFIGLGFYYPLLHNVVFINLFLAGFNMIPFGPFDGYKVRNWSWGVWLAAVILIVLVAIGFNKFI